MSLNYKEAKEWFRMCDVQDMRLSEVKAKLKLYVCLTKHHAMKAYWRSGSIAPLILDLVIRWRWVVSFTSQPRTENPTIGHDPSQIPSNSYPRTIFPEIHLSVIIPAFCLSSTWPTSRFPYQNCICIRCLLIVAAFPAHPSVLDFIFLTIVYDLCNPRISLCNILRMLTVTVKVKVKVKVKLSLCFF